MKTAKFIRQENLLKHMPNHIKDPVLKEIKSRVDGQVLDFIRSCTKEIIEQARADTNSEVPRIPIFDDYLQGLETRLEVELGEMGYFNGTVRKLIENYRNVFYYSSLPNLMERSPDRTH